MNSLKTTFVAAVLTTVAGPALLAQAPNPADRLVGNPQDLIAQSCGLMAHDGGLVAAGHRWKASFAASGVAFTPALGSRVPHNMPLQLSTLDVRRGGKMLQTTAPVAPQQQGSAVVYPRGDMAERYDVLPAGLKQSFVFDRPLQGDGDLVVRCAVTSQLQPATQADGTLSFTLPEVGGVRIGKVVGIDADGDRAEGSLRYDDGMLELVLPDAFLDTASYPLTLDPLIGTEFQISAGGDNGYDSDIAYDVTTNRYLVVYNERFSFTDIDVFGVRLSSSGAVIGSTIFVDLTVSTVRRPRVANVSANDRFLVVWQSAASPLGPWDVRCRAVNASDGSLSAIVDVAATTASEVNPSVGGDASGADDEAVVVWESPTGIEMCQVTLAASGDPLVFGTANLIAGSSANTPAISKACDSDSRLVVVWQDSVLPAPEIKAVAITRNLTVLGSVVTVSNNAVADSSPAVDGDGSTFMVAWQRLESAGAPEQDIVVARLAVNGSGATLAVGETAVEATPAEDEYDADIAYLGSRFAVVFAQRSNALFDDIGAWLVNPDCTTCNARVTLMGLNGPSWNREQAPRLAATWIHDNNRDDAMVSFSEALDIPPFTSRIVGQRLENQGPGSAPVVLPGGCGLGGNATVSGGPCVVGNAGFGFSVSGLDPNALLFLSTGLGGGALFCGACTFTNPLSFDFKINAAGTGSSAFPIPCDPQFVGLTVETQWVTFNTAFSPCPLAASLSASQRLQVTIQP